MPEGGSRLAAAVALIDLTVADAGLGDEQAFTTDRILVDATAFRIMHIAEAVSGLSATIKARHRDIPWDRISGMRNRLAHDYNGMSHALIWRTVRESLDDLWTVCAVEMATNKTIGE